MEIAVLSNSWTEIYQYLATRCPPTRLGPLIGLLLIAAWACSPPATWLMATSDVAFLTLLVILFRLWDDLCDLPLDREQHPDRVLVRSTSLARFWSFTVVLGLLSAVIAGTRSLSAFSALLLCAAGLGAWYRLRRPAWRTANYHIVLLKYPVFVFVLVARSGDLWTRVAPGLTLSCGVVYLFLCTYEVCHDRALRVSRWRVVLAGVEALALMTLVTVAFGRQLATSSSEQPRWTQRESVVERTLP